MPENLKLRTPAYIEEKILHLRQTYHLEQLRIKLYVIRYQDIEISKEAVYYVLKRNGLNKLPNNGRKRSMPTFKPYVKQVPGHRIQDDVKFLTFKDPAGKLKKMYQYTAIDNATRSRALKTYPKHNQCTAIEFVDYVRRRFPFQIHTFQTGNGYEFQVKFNLHCEDNTIRHVYLKPRSPDINDKVERSHAINAQ